MKAITRVFHVSIVLFFVISQALASNPEDAKKMLAKSSTSVEFVENKGQIVDQHGNPNNDVLFMAQVPGGAIHVKHDGVSFSFIKQEGPREPFTPKNRMTSLSDLKQKSEKAGESQAEIYRVDMQFNRAQKSSRVSGLEMLPDYNNYYLAHCREGITHVRKYRQVYYENVYENIDFVLYVNPEGKTQYDFIVNPGGNPDDIQFAFKGADNIRVKADGSLIVETPFGNIEQGAPYSYQEKKVPSAFKLREDHSVGFQVGTYDKTRTLVIDPPTRLWATYYGGPAYDDSNGLVVDNDGYVFVSGYTESSTNIATTGSHQEAYAGGDYDAFLVKFNNDGVRQWGTYYGGSNFDTGYLITIDSNGNIYMGGQSNSAGLATVHQTTFTGTPGLLIKFDNDGTLDWATYYGDNNDTWIWGIAVDADDNVFITGVTYASSGISTAGSHQPDHANIAAYDAFLAKFNSNGVRQWGSYFGGEDYDMGYDMNIDRSGNVLISGMTLSTDGIATIGSHQETNGGGYNDAFLAKFTNNGTLLWATYYGGNQIEYCYGITTDAQENIFLSGTTNSDNNIATLGVHQESRSGSYDAFLVKFDAMGQRQWGTYYGGENSDFGYLVRTDQAGNVFMSGNTGSEGSIATPDAFQTVLQEYSDAFFAQFNNAGVLQYATYYGGPESGEWGWGIAFDNAGNVFFSGNTQSTTGISTPGSHQENLSGNHDPFIVKFQYNACVNPDEGGTITGIQTIIAGTAPDALSSENVPLNYSGTLEFKWQFSTTNDSEGFQDIPDSNNATYQPGTLSQTTWFRRLARVNCASDWSETTVSNAIRINTENPEAIPLSNLALFMCFLLILGFMIYRWR